MRGANWAWTIVAIVGCGGAAPTSEPPHPAPAPAACIPSTCEQLHVSCGPVGDGCGNTLDCGACPLPGGTLGGGSSSSETGTVRSVARAREGTFDLPYRLALDPMNGERVYAVHSKDPVDHTATLLFRTRPDGARRWMATFVPKTENPNVPPEEHCRVTALAPARNGDVWVGLSVVVDDCMLGSTAITPGDHLLRFDPSGNLITERRFPRGPAGFAAIQSLSATRDGSVTVGGLFGGEVDLGKGTVIAQQGTTSGYVARYDRDLMLVWARVVGGEHGSGNVLDVATGPDDQTLVGGLIDGDATLAGTSMPGTGERGFLVQLDPQSGPSWVRTIAERVPLVDYSPLGTAVAVALGSSATWGEHTGTGGQFLIAAEKDGTPRWLRTWSMAAFDLAVDGEGALRLLAYAPASTDFGGGKGHEDGTVLVKLGLDGNHRWTQRFPRTFSSGITGPSMAVDPSGQTVALLGYGAVPPGPLTFGAFSVPHADGDQSFIVVFDR